MTTSVFRTIQQIAAETKIPVGTLKVKLHLAKQAGIELPPRRRVGKIFIYDYESFLEWLWHHAPSLKRDFHFGGINKQAPCDPRGLTE